MSQFTMMPESFGDACAKEIVALMNAVGKVWSETKDNLTKATDAELDMFDAYGELMVTFQSWKDRQESEQRERLAFLNEFINLGRDDASTD